MLMKVYLSSSFFLPSILNPERSEKSTFIILILSQLFIIITSNHTILVIIYLCILTLRLIVIILGFPKLMLIILKIVKKYPIFPNFSELKSRNHNRLKVYTSFKSMLLTVLILFAIYWLILSLFAFYNVRKILAYLKSEPKIDIKEEWKGFINDHVDQWDQRSILIGCFTKFPYNVTLLIQIIAVFPLIILLTKNLGEKGRRFTIWFEKLYSNFALRRAYNIIEEVDYQNYKITTPLIISNHVSWIDTWFYPINFMPVSIVGKAALKRTPLVGTICDFFHTIYVDRENESQRDTVISKISERVKEFQATKDKPDSERTPPLVIFPQGTTTNGKNIITFKMGAFNDLAPITMFALKYQSKQFHMGMGDITQSQHAIVSLCIRPTIEIKHKIMTALPGETPEEYCKRCREQMGKLTGFPLVESRYRDLLEFEKAREQARRQRKVQDKTKGQ